MKLSKLSTLGKLLCVQGPMIVAYIITSKFCNNSVNVIFRIVMDITSTAILIYPIKDFVKTHKEEKNKKVWLTEHMAILPMSKEVVFIVNSQIEKWQEDIISKVEKAASEEGLKVTVNSPLSEVIDNYYL